jgi:hypothetical protein
VFNRRYRMKPGAIPPDPFGGNTDRVRMNPGVGNPDVLEPAGPVDPQVFVLSALAAEGRPIALLANYGLHYVGGVGAGHLSADYFGAFAGRVAELLDAEKLDPPFVAMMSNGASGDVNNVDVRAQPARLPPYAKIRQVAERLAQEAVKAHRAARFPERVSLAAAQAEVRLGVRRPTPLEVARARDILAQAKGPVLTTLPEVYARETVLLAEYPAEVPVILQALRVGDLAIAAIPCEVFADIGLELKRRSPLRPAFVISLANGYHGYLPTPEHHALGGYETWRARSSYLEVEASRKITARLLDLLASLR